MKNTNLLFSALVLGFLLTISVCGVEAANSKIVPVKNLENDPSTIIANYIKAVGVKKMFPRSKIQSSPWRQNYREL